MKVLDRISPRAAKGATLALLVLGLGLVAAAALAWWRALPAAASRWWSAFPR